MFLLASNTTFLIRMNLNLKISSPVRSDLAFTLTLTFYLTFTYRPPNLKQRQIHLTSHVEVQNSILGVTKPLHILGLENVTPI